MFSIARALLLSSLALATFVTPRLAVPSAEAAESSSLNFRNTRSAVNAGGGRKNSAGFRDDGTAGDLGKSTWTSASFLGRDGLQSVYHYPSRVTDLFASSAAASSQIYLQWTTPGNDDGEATAPGAYIVRYSSIAADAPAISDAKFNAATAVSPAPPAAQVKGNRLTMNVTGLNSGVTYYFAIKAAERDGSRSQLSAGATAQTVGPYGCAITRNVHKVDGPYTTIQSAVDSLPQSLNGHACVIVRDSASYDEQVWVRNFVNNGSSITIAADPALSGTPRVNPPAASTAAFLVHNASVNVYGLDIRVAAAIPYGIFASSSYVRISSVSVSTSGALGLYAAGIRVSSWTSIDNTTVTVWNAHGLWLDRATMTAVHNSSFQVRHIGFNAVWFNGASSNTFNASVASNSIGTGIRMDENAVSNAVRLSTAYAAADAVFLFAASSNTVDRSVLRSGAARGMLVSFSSNFTRVLNSTVTAQDDGIDFTGSSSATVSGSVVWSAGTYGINQDSASSALRVDGSTVASAGGGNSGWMMRGSTNVVTNTYIQNVASNAGGMTVNGSNANVLDGVRVAGDNSGISLAASSSNTIRNSLMNARQSSGGGLNLSQGAFNNVIAFSTVTNSNASGIALILTRASTTTIFDSYVQASTGVLVDGSTGTALIDSVIAATNGNGSGVKLAAGAVNFTMSSTTLLGTTAGGTASRGVYADKGNRGLIDISSSLISGFHRGIALTTQTPGTEVWVTSNTIVVPVAAAADTYGLRADGLASGATIQDNSIVFRTAGAAQYAAGAFFEASDGVVFRRNRLSNPGMVTSGVSELLRLADGDDMLLHSNDFHSTGTALSQAYLLRLTTGSVNVSLRGNVFFSSLTVAGSSFTLSVAADSQSGFDSDYNDFFSSNSALSFQWGGGAAVQGLAGWQGASGGDLASISAHPQWFDVSAGVEDFHPRSTQGRWNPGTSAFVLDGTNSPTLDQGDPAHPYGLEPQPSGGRVNQGSYANTGYASKSVNTYPGCVATSLVNAVGGPYFTIQQGVDALPSTLAGHSCVVIKDGATYAEQVWVRNFTMNGSSISIFADPATGFRPLVAPVFPSTAAFRVNNASVNIAGVQVAVLNAVPYGILVSSSHARVTDVIVSSAGYLGGIRLKSWSAVTASSVTAWDGAHAFWLDQGSRTSVASSSFGVRGQANGGHALYLDQSSSNTFTAVTASATGAGFYLNQTTNNEIYASSAVSTSITYGALYASFGSSNAAYGSYLGSHGAFVSGNAVVLLNSHRNTLHKSTAAAATGAALYAVGADSNTVFGSTLLGLAGLTANGAVLSGGSDHNSIQVSSVTTLSSAVNLEIDAGYGNIVSGSYLSAAAESAFRAGNNSRANQVTGSVIVNAGGAAAAYFIQNGSTNTLTASTVRSNSHNAVELAGGGWHVVAGSTLTSLATAAGRSALAVVTASSVTAVDSYIQGSTAVWVSGSSFTALGDLVLVATNSFGAALAVTNGSNGLTLSSSVLTVSSGALNSAALRMETAKGLLRLSTNTLSGGLYTVSVSSLGAGAQLWMTSNTIVMPLSTLDSCGVCFTGLAGGATVQNNAIVRRARGSLGGGTHSAVSARSSANLLIERNRISNPGLVTAGSFVGLRLDDVDDSIVRYNDVHSTGTALTDAFMLVAINDTAGLKLHANVFSSSLTVTGAGSSSATVSISPDSQAGFEADFNTYHSSNSALSFLWGNAAFSGIAAWRGASGKDLRSSTAHPQWFDAGGEDFHPRSSAGRFNPATQAFVNDGSDSPTIDQGDFRDSYLLETAPNGGRSNQGSYGGTAEASRSPAAACEQTRYVGKGGLYPTIQSAVDSLAKTLTGPACVYVTDTAVYNEQVTVEGFTNNGSTIAITGDPFLGMDARPTINVPGSSAGFRVKNSSVTLSRFYFTPAIGAAYAVQASSSYVRVSSVSASGSNLGAFIALAGQSEVRNSSAVLTAISADGVELDGSVATVADVAIVLTGGTGRGVQAATGVSSVTVLRSMLTTQGHSLSADSGSYFEVRDSTLTADAVGGYALSASAVSSVTIDSSYFQTQSGVAVSFTGANASMTVTGSTVIAGGGAALSYAGSYVTLARSFFRSNGTAVDGVNVLNGAFYALSQSTFITLAASGRALETTSVDSMTVTDSYIQAANQTGLYLDAGSDRNVVLRSTAVGTGTVAYGAHVLGDNNLLADSFFYNDTDCAVVIAGGASFNSVHRSTAIGPGSASGDSGICVDGDNADIRGSYASGYDAIDVAAVAGVVVATSTAWGVNSGVFGAVGVDGLTVSGSRLHATASSGAGYRLGTNYVGLTRLSSSTLSGGQYGASIPDAGGAQTWITSNTFVLPLATANDTAGLLIAGLNDGATVQDNAFVHRAQGSMGAFTSFGLSATGGFNGLRVERNRFSNPGMLTAGSFVAASFVAGDNVQFLYNDVHSSGTGLTNSYLLQLNTAVTGMKLKGNVFSSSVTASSSYTITMDAGSQPGFVADYNDYFSSNSISYFQWSGAAFASGLTAWRALSGQDANSLSAQPLWADPRSTAEDFHPKSAGGRYNPLTQAFVTDAATAGTIDSGDPADPFAAETPNNGSRANMGSYSNTAEASRSVVSAYPGCVTTRFVDKADGPYVTIQAAVDSLPLSLTGHSCVVVNDAAAYDEQVTVRNFVNGGSSITIVGQGNKVVPPAASTAAFHVAQASVNVYGFDLDPSAAVQYGVLASSAYVRLSSVNVDGGAALWGWGFHVSSWTTVSYSSVTAGTTAGALRIADASNVDVSFSTFASASPATDAVQLQRASSNTFTRTVSSSTGDNAFALLTNSRYNTVQLSTVTSDAATAFIFSASSFNTVDRSVVRNGGSTEIMSFVSTSNFNLVWRSSLTASAAAVSGLFSSYSSSNALRDSFVRNAAGTAVHVATNSHSWLIERSTVVGGGSGHAVWFNAASSPSVVDSYAGAASGRALYVHNRSDYASVRGSSLFSAAGAALRVDSSSAALVDLSFARSAGAEGGEVESGADLVTVYRSTFIGDGGAAVDGLYVAGASRTVVRDSYVQGPDGLEVFGATNTYVYGGVLVATGTGRVALEVTRAVGFSASTTSALSPGVGASLGADNARNMGVIGVHASTLTSLGGVHVSTHAAGARVLLSSNTIIMIGGTSAGFGVDIEGLATGATVYNNTIMLRDRSNFGASTAMALRIKSAAGVVFSRNRVSNSGYVIGTGFFYGAYLSDADNVTFTYNDVYSTATASSGVMLRVGEGSTGARVRNNILFSSMTAPGVGRSTATVIVADAASMAGWSSDYNDLASSNTAGFQWGASGAQGLAAWQALTGQDAQSISVNPLWVDPEVEDFHPRSSAGRWDPEIQGWQFDTRDSLTLDRGDPAEAFASEAAPNGGRVNMGSYGNTAEASRSNIPSAGCVVTKNVSQGSGPYYSVAAALESVPNPLIGHSCVVVTDGATYMEQVVVEGFEMDGSSLSIYADPGSGLRPLFDPPDSSSAAFVIRNSSVNLGGFGLAAATEELDYGVWVTSWGVRLSSMQVIDPGIITLAGVRLDTGSTLTHSTVSMAAAHGVLLAGPYNQVLRSSLTTEGLTKVSLYVAAADSNTVTDSFLVSPNASALLIDGGSWGNAVERSTISAGGGATAAWIFSSSSNTIRSSRLFSPLGFALLIDGGSERNTVERSTMSAAGSAVYAALISGASRNTLTGSLVTNSVGSGLRIDAGAQDNLVYRSTLSAVAASQRGLYIVGASSNIVAESYLRSELGDASVFELGASSNEVRQSTLSVVAAGYAAQRVDSSSYNRVTDSLLMSAGGDALFFNDGANRNVVLRSTMLVTGTDYSALNVVGSSSNSIEASYLNSGAGHGVSIQNGSHANALLRSTVTANVVAAPALFLSSAVATRVEDSWVSNAAGWAVFADSRTAGTVIARSSVTSGGVDQAAVHLASVSGTFIVRSYVQGSTAVFVMGSTGTRISHSVLVATNTQGAGLFLSAGSLGLDLSSSVLIAPSQGMGARVTGAMGLVRLSTNTFLSGRWGVFLGTQSAGASLWVASNTIVVPSAAGYETYGVAFDGLLTGATVQNNAIVHRAAGGANNAYGVWGVSSARLVIERNRISNPGRVTSGRVTGLRFADVDDTLVRYNDVHSTGTGLTAAYGLRATDFSTGLQLRANVFLSSWSVSGASATLSVTPGSQTGFVSDYNSYFSSAPTLSFEWGSAAVDLGGWQAASGDDANSRLGHPQWFDPGNEDFHPRSEAGRYDPAT